MKVSERGFQQGSMGEVGIQHKPGLFFFFPAPLKRVTSENE